MSNFHRRLSFGGISPSKFVQKHSVGGISPKKFVQKHSVGEISPKKGLRQPSAGASGPKRRRRKGKRSFGGRGKTVNEKRNAGHTQANPTCTRHNNSTIQQFNRAKPSTTQRAQGANNSTGRSPQQFNAPKALTIQQFNRAKPSTTQRAKGANHSTSIHEHLLRACFSLSQRRSGRRTSVAAD